MSKENLHIPSRRAPIRYRGTNARPREAEKIDLVLGFIYEWQFINLYVAQMLLELGRTAAYETLCGMEQKKLLQQLPAPMSSGTVYMLTAMGLAHAQLVIAPDVAISAPIPPIHPSRIILPNVNHDLIAQALALHTGNAVRRHANNPDTVRVVPARQLQKMHYGPGEQVADAEVTADNNEFRILIEVQETYDTTMVRRLSRHAERVACGEASNVMFASTNQSIIDFYREAMESPDLSPWEYLETQKRWVKHDDLRSPYTDDVQERFSFKYIPNKRSFYRY
jgi:hypothetical protein